MCRGKKLNFKLRLNGQNHISLKLILSYYLLAGNILTRCNAMSLPSQISTQRLSNSQPAQLEKIIYTESTLKVRMGKKRVFKRSLNLTARQSGWSTREKSESTECPNFLDKNASKKLLNSMEKFEVLPKVRDRLLVTRHKAASLLDKMVRTENIYLSVWKMMLNSPMNQERCKITELYSQSSQEILIARLSTLSSAHRVFREIHQHLNLNQEKYAAGMGELLTQNKLAFCNFKLFLYLYDKNNDKKILDTPAISEPVTLDLLNRDILHLLLNCQLKNTNSRSKEEDENSFGNSVGQRIENQESVMHGAGISKKAIFKMGGETEKDKGSTNGWTTLSFLNIKERSQRVIRDVLVLDAYVNILDHVIDMITGMLAAKDLIEATTQ